MADIQVFISINIATKRLPKTGQCLPEQQKTGSQENILGCQILQTYRT